MIVSFHEIHDGRGGGDEISSKEQSKVEFTRKFRAVTSSPYDGPDVVLAAMDRLGTPHPAYPNAFLRRRRAENFAKSKLVWIATAQYSSDPIVSQSPQSDPPQASWDTESFSRPYEYDKDGKPVANSMTDAFVPPPSDTDAFWVCTVKRNATFVPTWLLSYRNCVNSDQIVLDGVTVPPLCGWLKSIKISPIQFRNQIAYRALQFQIACKDGHQLRAAVSGIGPTLDDWKKYICDRGNRKKSQDNPDLPNYGKPVPIVNADGTAARIPCYLDGSGINIVTPTPDNVVFLPFHLKPEQPFGILPLW
jgi:hypothetical protein